MPYRPALPCCQPGCHVLVHGGGYCATHRGARYAAYDATRRKTDPALSWAAGVRNSSRWQKVRAIHRATDPLCCDPFGDHAGMPAPNEESHHVTSLVECFNTQQHDLAFDLTNLAPLCIACHARVSALERAKKPTAHLFTCIRKPDTNANEAPQR